MLGAQTHAGCQTGEEEPQSRRLFQIKIETADRHEQAECHAHIRGDQGSMSEDIRLENQKDHREKCRAVSPHGTRHAKDRNSQEDCKNSRSQARPGDQRIGVVCI